MLRLVPIPTIAPPRSHPAMQPGTPRSARALAEECLAHGPVFATGTGTATGAFEALMDWVEGRP